MQGGSTIGIGAKVIKYFKKVASGGNLSNMGHLMDLSNSVPQYSLHDVKGHSDSSSCWIVLSDKVYDVTNFLKIHPGGEEIILENAGSDATIPFESKGHSREAMELLNEYCIGELIPKDRRYKT